MIYSTFEEKNGSVKMIAYDGRKSFYTKMITFDLNKPDNVNISERTETPLMYEYEGSFRKIECEWINTGQEINYLDNFQELNLPTKMVTKQRHP